MSHLPRCIYPDVSVRFLSILEFQLFGRDLHTSLARPLASQAGLHVESAGTYESAYHRPGGTRGEICEVRARTL